MGRPRLAVFKFASCDGCQLTLLDCEDELLQIAEVVEIAHFLEASSRVLPGPYDVALVEGSVTTAADAERIREIRTQSEVLIAIGACATAGGIQALRNGRDLGALAAAVYPQPDQIAVLADSTPISAHVPVDLELHGCPISKAQLLEVLSATLSGRRPRLPEAAQCTECKRAGTVCVMVAKGVPCLGPVTRAGCGNLCPRLGRGCYGCFGPAPGAGIAALSEQFAALGLDEAERRHLFRNFNVGAPEFRAAGGEDG